jgi:hypothetical protein
LFYIKNTRIQKYTQFLFFGTTGKRLCGRHKNIHEKFIFKAQDEGLRDNVAEDFIARPAFVNMITDISSYIKRTRFVVKLRDCLFLRVGKILK